MLEQTACLGLPWPNLAHLGLPLASLASLACLASLAVLTSLNGAHSSSGRDKQTCARTCARTHSRQHSRQHPRHKSPTLNVFRSFASLPLGLSEFDSS